MSKHKETATFEVRPLFETLTTAFNPNYCFPLQEIADVVAKAIETQDIAVPRQCIINASLCYMNQQKGYFGHQFLSSIVRHRPAQRGVIFKAISDFFDPGRFQSHGHRVNSLLELLHKNGAIITGRWAKNIVTQLTNYILCTPHGGSSSSLEVRNLKNMITRVPSHRKHVRGAILKAFDQSDSCLRFRRGQERICVLMKEEIFIPNRSDAKLITSYAIQPPQMKEYYGKEEAVGASCQETLTVLLETQPTLRQTALRTAERKKSSIVRDILQAKAL